MAEPFGWYDPKLRDEAWYSTLNVDEGWYSKYLITDDAVVDFGTGTPMTLLSLGVGR